MTVKELREMLASMDDNLIVLEERTGEIRVLRREDVSMDRNTVDASSYHTADGEEITGGVVIFRAWG